MTTIKVWFAERTDDKIPTATFTLYNRQPSSDDSEVLVKNASILERARCHREDGEGGGDRDIWVGDVIQSGGRIPLGKLVFKVAVTRDSRTDLKGEFGYYKKELKSLQGRYVPRCYGRFKGTTFDEISFDCLVFEYAGERPDYKFESVSMDERLRVRQAYRHIHLAGLQHNNFTEPHVLFREANDKNQHRGPFIIDFEQATRHKCPKYPRLFIGALAPDLADFDCEEMYDVTMYLGLWRNPIIPFFGVRIYEELISSPQDILDIAAGQTRLSDENLKVEAEKLWARVQELRARDAEALESRRRAKAAAAAIAQEDNGKLDPVTKSRSEATTFS